MTKAGFTITAALLLISCSEEPTPKEAETVQAAAAEAETADAIKAEKKSLEEAADAAAKLVEEESRQEIEALGTTDAP